MKPWAKAFYYSPEWRKTRELYSAGKFYLCERCGKPGEIVHHKVYITPKNVSDANVTLNFDNLELLCRDCHNREHISTSATDSSLLFDANGDLRKRD